MSDQVIRCANCGTTWPAKAVAFGSSYELAANDICPVCHLSVDDSNTIARIESVTDLEAQLNSLVRGAWASGLDTESIVGALRGELAFAAELGHAGRRFTVQLIDLGPQEYELQQRPLHDQRELLSNRRGAA